MKRFLALFITATLSLSAAFGVLADDKGLADAITAAKQYITVPAGRTEIDYGISEGENGAVIINISWSDDKGSTDVTLDKDGCLLSYSNNVYDYDEAKGLAKLTGQQTKAKADAFLKTVYGNGAADFRLEHSKLDRHSHSYSYYLYKNNIKVTTANASISVDPDLGEISYYNGTGKEFLSLKYPTANGVLDIKNAMLAFFDGESPKPEYRIYTDYKDRKVTKSAFLAFSVYDTTTAVNAFSGSKVNVNRYFNEYRAQNSAASMDAASETAKGTDEGFTSQELEAIEQSDGLISSQHAAEIIKDNFPVAKNTAFTKSSINKNNYTDEYYINIRGNNVNASLNAKTGKVISFYYYKSSQIEPKTALTKEEIAASENNAEPIVKTLVEKLAPVESKKLAQAEFYTNSYDNEVSVTYNRVENGYECDGNYITATVNAEGDITSYKNSFDEKLTFPQPINVLKDDKAAEALADLFDFELSYTVDESYKVDLVYAFNKTGLMSSSAKALINYKGEPEAKEVESGISDIKGHWCENIVTQLYNNGYKLNDTLFRPDIPITRAELDTLYNNYPYKPYYIENDDSTEDNSTITRYELAEYIMEYYNLDKLKNHPEIFSVTDYKDGIDEKYIPAVAIATAFGAMKGDNTDSFNGNKSVTRAEAAAALYNMLTAEE